MLRWEIGGQHEKRQSQHRTPEIPAQAVRREGIRLPNLSAKDILGPGGGVYITGDAPLTEQHLNWLERRSLTPDAPTFVDVVFVKGTVPAKASDDEIDGDLARRHSEQQRRAEASSREVAKNAQEVAKQAEEVFQRSARWTFPWLL